MEKLKEIMKECLETRGYEVTEEKLNELWEIYEDCQEWSDTEMLTGTTYDEVEDFVKHSPCVNEVFSESEETKTFSVKIEVFDKTSAEELEAAITKALDDLGCNCVVYTPEEQTAF